MTKLSSQKSPGSLPLLLVQMEQARDATSDELRPLFEAVFAALSDQEDFNRRLWDQLADRLAESDAGQTVDEHGEDHQGGHDDIGTATSPKPDAYTGVVGDATLGFSPGDHVHPSTVQVEGSLKVGGQNDPQELVVGNELEQLTVKGSIPPVPIWNPQPDWPAQAPAQITGDLDDYAPGFPPVGIWALDADQGGHSITGIDAGDEGLGSRKLILFNSSAFNIIMLHQNAGSAAANRFVNTTGIDDVMLPGQTWELNYLPGAGRWLARPDAYVSIFSRGGDPLLSPIPNTLTAVDLPSAEFNIPSVDYTWTLAPTSIVTVNRTGIYQVWVEVEAEVIGAGTGNPTYLLELGISVDGAAPTQFAEFLFNRDGGDATVNTLVPLQIPAGTTIGLQARLTGSVPVGSSVDSARLYLLRLSQTGDDVSAFSALLPNPVRTQVTVSPKERSLGDVRTIYRTAPTVDAWDTPNLVSSRFEAGLAFSLTAAYQNLPIGTVHTEEAIYTYDGLAEDVEILEPGLYEISGTIGYESSAAGKLATAALLKNGAVLGAPYTNSVAQTGRIISLTPIVVTLAATDKISLGSLSSSGGLLPTVEETTLTIVKRRITT